MALSWIRRMLKKNAHPASRPCPTQPTLSRFLPALECLDERILPAITATFVPQAHLLTVLGDSANNTITISRDAAGTILVNGGAVRISGGTPTVANTVSI